MSGRFAVRARIVALAFAAAFVFSTIAAQASSNDVKGIDVVVKKKPGGAIVAHGVTGPDGSVDLGNLPKGAYALTLTLPQGVPAAAQVKTAGVTIGGAAAPIAASWNFETGRTINPAAAAGDRAAVQDSVSFDSDGNHHVVIKVEAQASVINSSRSNIKGNIPTAHVQASPSAAQSAPVTQQK